tara:strand:+ start:1119 stop:1247 length:129 start_codon:yes stop_codon:yes gene_type:complete
LIKQLRIYQIKVKVLENCRILKDVKIYLKGISKENIDIDNNL